jgi:hypothetical protein
MSTEMQPKDKSDSKWLRDAGYSGMTQFMISYGFKMPEDFDDAKKLLAQFRADQQKEWEEKSAKRTPEEIAEIVLWHLRAGHLGWEALKHLPTAGQGVPDFVGSFNLDDIPICQACVAVLGKDR